MCPVLQQRDEAEFGERAEAAGDGWVRMYRESEEGRVRSQFVPEGSW